MFFGVIRAIVPRQEHYYYYSVVHVDAFPGCGTSDIDARVEKVEGSVFAVAVAGWGGWSEGLSCSYFPAVSLLSCLFVLGGFCLAVCPPFCFCRAGRRGPAARGMTSLRVLVCVFWSGGQTHFGAKFGRQPRRTFTSARSNRVTL